MKRPPLRDSQGFTLMEMIVTMAVSAMVMTLIISLLILVSRVTAQYEEAAWIRQELTQVKAVILRSLSRQDRAELVTNDLVCLPEILRDGEGQLLQTADGEQLSLKTVTGVSYQRRNSLLRVTVTYIRQDCPQEFVFLYHFHTWS